MRLEGLHHVTAITADALANADFYAGVLGLRRFEPRGDEVFYGDRDGAAGSLVAFLEQPRAAQGRASAGMVHELSWRVAGEAALDFWAERLAAVGRPVERHTAALTSSDPEGLAFELLVANVDDPPLTSVADGIPAEHALQGLHGVRAYTRDPAASERVLKAFNFEAGPGGLSHRVGGGQSHAVYVYDHPPGDPGFQGAGTVHHVAWSARPDEHGSWRTLAQMAGVRPTEVAGDPPAFEFVEPSGVRFEIVPALAYGSTSPS